jgi:hypothetical protein
LMLAVNGKTLVICIRFTSRQSGFDNEYHQSSNGIA